MVTTLFESGAKRKKPKAGLAASVAVHGVLIAAALSAGGHMAASTLEKPKAENIKYVEAKPLPEPEPKKVYVAPKPKAATPAPKRASAPRVQLPAPRQQAAPAPVAPAAPRIDVPANVPVLNTPTVVPTSLPAIDPNALETTSDIVARASDLVGSKGVAGGSSSGRVESESGGDVGVSRGDGSAWGEEQVDRAVQPMRIDPPRYPETLRSANISGTVMLRFVVGPDGRVEMGSVQVLDSPHDAFTDAVKTSLRKARYRPAEVRGKKVRQLVEQSFQFQLDRR